MRDKRIHQFSQHLALVFLQEVPGIFDGLMRLPVGARITPSQSNPTSRQRMILVMIVFLGMKGESGSNEAMPWFKTKNADNNTDAVGL